MRKVKLALYLLPLLIWFPVKSSLAGNNEWTISGPAWASSRIIEIDPENTEVVYGVGENCGTGLFRSSDGAETWNLSNNGMELYSENIKRITAFSLDPINPDNLYCALTDDNLGDEDYVFRSTNGGGNWERVMQSFGPLTVNLNCIDAFNGKVYLGAGEHLYHSSDGGETWSQDWSFSNDIRGVVLDPENVNELYVGAGSNLYKSSDGGETFNHLQSFSGSFLIHVGFQHIWGDSILTVSSYRDGFYISYNSGATWDKRDNGLPVTGTNIHPPYDIAFSTVSEETIYAAVTFGGIYKTTDGGINWVSAADNIDLPYSDFTTSNLLGVSVTCFSEEGDDTVYLASNIGVHRSVDGTDNWEVVGIPGQYIETIDFFETDPFPGYAGSWRGIFSHDGTTWDETALLAELGVSTTSVTVHPSDPQIILAGITDAFNYIHLCMSIDGGNTWTESYSGMGQESGRISAIVYKPDDHLQVFATMWTTSLLYNDGGLIYSSNGGTLFLQDPFFNDTPLTGLSFAPGENDMIYVCDYYGHVWVSEDGGQNWTAVSSTGITNRVIAVHPVDPLRVYVGGESYSDALKVSVDGGENWNSAGFGSGLIKEIVFNDDYVFLAAYGDGIWYGNGFDGQWYPINDGLDNLRVNDLWVSSIDLTTRLFAATSGSGVWEAEFTELGIGGRFGPIEMASLQELPHQVVLAMPYPSPATDNAIISYALPDAGYAELAIYDLTGRRVITLVRGEHSSGQHEAIWSCLDQTPGVYLCHLTTGDKNLTRRLVICR